MPLTACPTFRPVALGRVRLLVPVMLVVVTVEEAANVALVTAAVVTAEIVTVLPAMAVIYAFEGTPVPVTFSPTARLATEGRVRVAVALVLVTVSVCATSGAKTRLAAEVFAVVVPVSTSVATPVAEL